MFPRPSFMFLFCLLVSIVFSNRQPPNPSNNPPTKAKPRVVGQSFVVNNNCGLANAEREIIGHIKAKVDFIAQQYRNGRYNINIFFLRRIVCALLVI